MDEACSNLQVQLESKPEAIDVLERRLIRLQASQHPKPRTLNPQVEEKALEREGGPKP